MVRAYLAYENFVKEKSKKDFPFYLDWILNWESHEGLLKITDPEILSDGCDACMEKFIKNNDGITAFALEKIVPDEEFLSKLIHILTAFNVKQIKKLVFNDNNLTKEICDKLATSICHQEYLEVLEISNNLLDSNALDTITKLFPMVPSLMEINLSNNKISSKSLSAFFKRINDDLELEILDLTQNLIDDSSLKKFIKHIIRKTDCPIRKLKLTGNKFSIQGIKTLHKAQRITKKITKGERNIFLELNMIPCTSVNIKEMLKREMIENIEIARKPMGGYGKLKEIPVKREYKDFITAIEEDVKKTMITLNEEGEETNIGPCIEDVKDILTKIEGLPFEFPMIKLEKPYTFVEKSLQIALQHDNLYCMEILLHCAKILGMDNIRGAEERLQNLKKKCEKVVSDLISVLNMENNDDNQINEILDASLAEAEKLGIRGDLIDTCKNLQIIRNHYVEEMQTKTDENSEPADFIIDEDVEAQREKIEDVFAPEFDIYIDKSPSDLKLTVEEDPNLGFHPYRADYIAISQLRPERVKQNLKVATDILRLEDSYAHMNISNRAQFLLCESFFEPAWGLAKNDKCLVISRAIFRYRNNLDQVFEHVVPPEPLKPLTIQYFF